MYFHTDSPTTITRLTSALHDAEVHDRRVRFDVDDKGRLRYKIGEDGWVGPLDSTPDPYRDIRPQAGVCQSHTDLHYFTDECIGYRDAVAIGESH